MMQTGRAEFLGMGFFRMQAFRLRRAMASRVYVQDGW